MNQHFALQSLVLDLVSESDIAGRFGLPEGKIRSSPRSPILAGSPDW
jgi:hypothetical protein